MNELIISAVNQAKSKYPKVKTESNENVIDVENLLIQLLHSDSWSKQQLEFFDGWMKKLDIAKKHYSFYQSNWKLAQIKTDVTNDIYALSLLVALQMLSTQVDRENKAGQLLKLCNVIFKITDLTESAFGLDVLKVKEEIIALVKNYKSSAKDHCVTQKAIVDLNPVLPITVLFWEGPIARAYLETIKEMGLKVKKIIKLVSSVDLITKKPVAKFLPQSMRANYAANKQFKQIFYWPNYYQLKNPELVKMIRNQVAAQYRFKESTLKSATMNIELTNYSEEVEVKQINGLKDPQLESTLKSEESDLFLFTGGGIVPDNLLSIKDKKLIHIHPGYLPEIRGADCVLWSQLLTQTTSASSFYLAPGIDVGDVILSNWLPDLKLNFTESLDNQVKYRSIYGFLDPWVRSYVLRQTIYLTKGLLEISTTEQNELDGMTFHFMHNQMKSLAFEKFN